jgi:hypothetical protein
MCPQSSFSFNTALEFQTKAGRQKKEIKEIQKGMEEVKLPLFSDNMILFLKHAKDSIKKLLVLIKTFGKVPAYKTNTQKLRAFLYTKNE